FRLIEHLERKSVWQRLYGIWQCSSKCWESSRHLKGVCTSASQRARISPTFLTKQRRISISRCYAHFKVCLRTHLSTCNVPCPYSKESARWPKKVQYGRIKGFVRCLLGNFLMRL